MNIQLQLPSMIMYLLKDNIPAQPVQASSRNYGFDFDEDEIGKEMLAPVPINLFSQTMPEVDADEFERVFPCFLS